MKFFYGLKPFNKTNLKIKIDLIEVELDYMVCSTIHESEDVKSVMPASEQLQNLDKLEIDFWGTIVMVDESHHSSLPSSTSEIDWKIVITFVVEGKARLPKKNWRETYAPPIYETKVTHPVEESKTMKKVVKLIFFLRILY